MTAGPSVASIARAAKAAGFRGAMQIDPSIDRTNLWAGKEAREAREARGGGGGGGVRVNQHPPPQHHQQSQQAVPPPDQAQLLQEEPSSSQPGELHLGQQALLGPPRRAQANPDSKMTYEGIIQTRYPDPDKVAKGEAKDEIFESWLPKSCLQPLILALIDINGGVPAMPERKTPPLQLEKNTRPHVIECE